MNQKYSELVQFFRDNNNEL
jgi:hypothetical protein